MLFSGLSPGISLINPRADGGSDLGTLCDADAGADSSSPWGGANRLFCGPGLVEALGSGMGVWVWPGSGVTLACPFFVPLFYQVCIQVPTRQPHSLSSELTGNCSLLTPDLRPRAQVYFSNLGKHWTCVGLGQL